MYDVLQQPQTVQNQGLGAPTATPNAQQQITNPYQGMAGMVNALLNPLQKAQNQVNAMRLQQLSQAGGPQAQSGQAGQPMNILPTNSGYGGIGQALFTQPPGGPSLFGTGSSGGAIW